MPTRSLGANTKDWNTGKERDAETGWDYFGARYYNPSIARWMNVDPMGDKFPSLSTYNYVFNNPVMVVDPDGMAPCCDDWWNEDPSKTHEYPGEMEVSGERLPPLTPAPKRGFFRRIWEDHAKPAAKSVANAVVQFGSGVLTAIADNNTFGATNIRENGRDAHGGSTAFEAGLRTGDGFSVI